MRSSFSRLPITDDKFSTILGWVKEVAVTRAYQRHISLMPHAGSCIFDLIFCYIRFFRLQLTGLLWFQGNRIFSERWSGLVDDRVGRILGKTLPPNSCSYTVVVLFSIKISSWWMSLSSSAHCMCKHTVHLLQSGILVSQPELLTWHSQRIQTSLKSF